MTVLLERAKFFHAVGGMDGKTDRRTDIPNLIVAVIVNNDKQDATM